MNKLKEYIESISPKNNTHRKSGWQWWCTCNQKMKESHKRRLVQYLASENSRGIPTSFWGKDDMAPQFYIPSNFSSSVKTIKNNTWWSRITVSKDPHWQRCLTIFKDLLFFSPHKMFIKVLRYFTKKDYCPL